MRRHSYFSLLPLFLILLSGCLGTKYLKEDEKLLYKQKIIADDKVDKEELSQLYVQRPNRQFPVIPFSPYVWFYYYGSKRYNEQKYIDKKEVVREKYNEKIANASSDKKIRKYERKKRNKIEKLDKNIQEGNVWMRWGEPIAEFDSLKMQETKDRFNLYLNSKGYFNSIVTTSIKTIGRKVSVKYKVHPGQPYIIDTLFVQTGDSAIYKILQENENESKLEIGENYDQSKLTEERERLDLLLKDNGYFDFSRQYVVFEVDTAFSESRKVAIKTTIKNPSKRGYHKSFTVDSINFITDANLSALPDSLRQTEYYRGISYRFYNKQYNKKVLSRRVFIEKDSLYSKSNTFDTQRQLANLDMFKFININYDSIGGKLVANIFTSPLNRYQWSNEVGINVTQGFPGPFYNLSFKKRNVFGGLETFEVNGRVGIEGVASATENEVYSSIEAGANASLTFPQFIIPISTAAKERLGKINPKTRLLAGYTYTDRPEYERENINFSGSYSWQNLKKALYKFTATDISVIKSTLQDNFKARLDSLNENGNNLINSFLPSFVSSMNLSVTWNFNSYGLNPTNSSFLRLFIESGGTSLNFVNTEFLENESLEFYKYFKVNVDYRKVHSITNRTTIAYRVNTGIARPYSRNNVLPYEKYFFAGGSNGIRAWRPRRLGPGSYAPIDSANLAVNYNFEQQGEILIEGSAELRANLIGFIDYALFVDFGNIWTIDKDPARPGAQFRPEAFYKEIAVGSGAGLRFDFNFLVLRLDAGIKIYDPARPSGKRFITDSGFYDKPFDPQNSEPVVLNIGIGYPF